jgi:hypothetical protein
VLTSFIWAGHAQALPRQIDMHASAAIAQPMTMTDCQPCASCYIGPPFTVHKAGGGNNLGHIAAPVTMRFVSQTDACEFFLIFQRFPCSRCGFCIADG